MSLLDMERQRLAAVALLEDGVGPKKIAEQLGVSRITVHRWKRQLKQTGSLKPSSLVRRQRIFLSDEDVRALHVALAVAVNRPADFIKIAVALGIECRVDAAERLAERVNAMIERKQEKRLAAEA